MALWTQPNSKSSNGHHQTIILMQPVCYQHIVEERIRNQYIALFVDTKETISESLVNTRKN